MTHDETEAEGAWIRADKLHRTDLIRFVGEVVRILDVQEPGDFPAGLELVLRRFPDGQPTTTLIGRAQRVQGVYLPRQVRLTCERCRWPMVRDIDLAVGLPIPATCGPCRRPRADHNVVVLPGVQRFW